MDALGLAAVLEENQSCLGKRAVAFRKRGLLNALRHRALFRYRDLDRRRRRIALTPLTLSAASHAGFRLRCGWNGRLPLRIFDGPGHQAEWLAGQGRLLSVDAERKVGGGQHEAGAWRAE